MKRNVYPHIGEHTADGADPDQTPDDRSEHQRPLIATKSMEMDVEIGRTVRRAS